MLTITFFITIFSTVLWLIYIFMNIGESLSGVPLSSLGAMDLITYVLAVTFPLFVLWMMFGYVLQFVNGKSAGNSLFSLHKQMKKNQEYTDLVARIMLEMGQGLKDSFVVGKFDLFISDINELLSEIIYRCNLASNEQIERLWSKNNNGGKWAFGKVIVEVNANQPSFALRVFDRSQSDPVLAGTILEFCARYLSLIALLEKHDKERVFLNVLETGVFGKVFSIMAPISDEVKRSRDVSSSRRKEDSRPQSILPQHLELGSEKESIISKINPFKKKEAFDEGMPSIRIDVEEDPFSKALERSFGSQKETFEPEVEEYEEPSMPEIVMSSEPRFEETSNTQKALDNLKKEWEDMRSFEESSKEPKFEDRPSPRAKPVAEEESLSYPFAGWTNDDDYKR